MKHTLFGLLLAGSAALQPAAAQTVDIYVSPHGRDTWAGTAKKPVATLERARQLARLTADTVSVTVWLADGTYYLPSTLTFTPADGKTYPATVSYRACHTGRAIVSGGQRLELRWEQGAGGVWWAQLPAEAADTIDQLYINGRRQRMARFPNARPGEGRNVYDVWTLSQQGAADSTLNPLHPSRTRRWQHPEGGIVHAMHHALWGDMHWTIRGRRPDGSLQLEGGWQNNRPSEMHPVFRMVENIREELDAPGEWFYDRRARRLYYMSEAGTDLNSATVEVVRLRELIRLEGTDDTHPVRGIRLEGLTLRHAARTFMDNKEPLLRSDWTLCRSGAVTLRHAADCALTDCEFDQVGGNAVMADGYNRHISVERCHIHHAGASGVVFAGRRTAVRSPLLRYGPQDYARMDSVPGPQGNDYPRECRVSDCLITHTGRDEKQTAPVCITMAARISVSHCSMYNVPRAGINIGDGTFGGHVIEYCDVFNTVLETGDHGSFNSWGRDRYWTPDVTELSRHVRRRPDMTWWDMREPNTLRYNRWRCDHGWDIDLDDGSSHYRIYNNVLLGGGLKMREGYDRIATNNILLNNTLHPHVWPQDNSDVFAHNIVYAAYRPAVMQTDIAPDGPWGRQLDYNLFVTPEAERMAHRVNGADAHSVCGDPQFLDAARGDYRVAPSSPALRIGFEPFRTDVFGVRCPRLRRLAQTPELPQLRRMAQTGNPPVGRTWRGPGITLREVTGEAMSAFGRPFSERALAVEQAEPASAAYALGLRSGDLLLALGHTPLSSLSTLQDALQAADAEAPAQALQLVRQQNARTLTVSPHALRQALGREP